MYAAKLLAVLMFVVVLEATHSVSEWKKYENGKVESHRKRVSRPPKNHTNGQQDLRNERILHSHHGEKMNRHQGENEVVEAPLETTGTLKAWEPEHHKNRHHKTEKKLHLKKQGDSKIATEQEEQPKGLVRISNSKQEENEMETGKPKKKRSKPEGMTSLAWRKAQKQAQESKRQMVEKSNSSEAEDDTPKRFRNNNNNKQKGKTSVKKMVIAKMDGNQKAKQMWKDAFRGENRITRSLN